MKAWEAQQLLDELDPDTEVTLTIGRAKRSKDVPATPVGSYLYPHSPTWIPADKTWPTQPPITCKIIQ